MLKNHHQKKLECHDQHIHWPPQPQSNRACIQKWNMHEPIEVEGIKVFNHFNHLYLFAFVFALLCFFKRLSVVVLLREMTPDFFLSFMSRIRNKSVSVYPSSLGQYITKARVRWFRGCLASLPRRQYPTKCNQIQLLWRHPSKMLKSIWYQNVTLKAARLMCFWSFLCTFYAK